jgi:hypothetical protein
MAMQDLPWLWKLITIALNDFNGLFVSLCFVLRFGDDEAIGLPNDVVEWHELSITDVVSLRLLWRSAHLST